MGGDKHPRRNQGSRIMLGPDAAPFQALQAKMEQDWAPQIMEVF
jgi:hypothetical protein